MTECKRMNPKVIGYWMSDKKRQKLNWTEFAGVCRKNGFELVKLDLNLPLEDQGPFTVILHKLTDIIALAGTGDCDAASMISRVESFIAAHPEMAVIDPLDNVRNLLDRYRSYSIIHNSGLEEVDVFTPTFVELTSNCYHENLRKLQAAGVDFPFVCKPSVAHGSSNAHKMCVIFNEAGVRDCRPPCVAQSFINHNALLYKIFVVGDEYFVVERPSLKNFYPCGKQNRDTIYFDSHDVSKADSTSTLSILDPEEAGATQQPPDLSRFRQIVTTLRQELGMSLLGIDVVIENNSSRYGIIDINAYPGYDGYPDFFETLINCINQIVDNHSLSLASTPSKPTSLPLNHENPSEPFCSPTVRMGKEIQASPSSGDQDDSGFDTSDSSDEKKKQGATIAMRKHLIRN